MNSQKLNYRSILINVALLTIPLLLVAIFYSSLPALQVPRIGLNGRYMKTEDKHLYYLIALIPLFLYYRLK